MIKNEHQRGVAERKLRDLREDFRAIEDPIDRIPYQSLIDDLREEIEEYDAIAGGRQSEFPLLSLRDLMKALIGARLARGWTQNELANELDVAEQQVQRDEAGGYESASVVRIHDALDALGYELTGVIRPVEARNVPSIPPSWREGSMVIGAGVPQEQSEPGPMLRVV